MRAKFSGHGGKARKLMIAPNPHFPIPTTPGFRNVRSSCGHNAKPSLSPHCQPVNFLIREGAIIMALLVGHGSKDASVAQGVPCSRQDESIRWVSHTAEPSI